MLTGIGLTVAVLLVVIVLGAIVAAVKSAGSVGSVDADGYRINSPYR